MPEGWPTYQSDVLKWRTSSVSCYCRAHVLRISGALKKAVGYRVQEDTNAHSIIGMFSAVNDIEAIGSVYVAILILKPHACVGSVAASSFRSKHICV